MVKETRQEWYILFIRGGREKNIIKDIHNSLRSNNLADFVNEIKILERMGNSGRTKNLLPGYIFVNCEMSEELLKVFYSVFDVISFLNHTKSDLTVLPKQISPFEVNNLLFLTREKPKSDNDYESIVLPVQQKKKSLLEIGDLILVKEGFFKDCRGSVTKIDSRKNLATINVDFLGRSTPVSVNFSECEKI